MLYISQILNKKIVQHEEYIGRVVDFVVSEGGTPYVEMVLVKKAKQKFFIMAKDIAYSPSQWNITKKIVDKPAYHENKFFLVEDLLDKQVIDVHGKRLVRVNDVLLQDSDAIKVEGIDIGFSGVLRRLGLPNMGFKNNTLPWSVIETFDYQTGNIKINLSQNSLNTFHPAEIADILEEVGTKERLGIVESLDAKKAAAAIEEANEETQSAILEQVPLTRLKTIVSKMHLSEIADVLRRINPFTENQILSSLGKTQAKNLQNLLTYQDDEAGGMMEVMYHKENGETTVGTVLTKLAENNLNPESIIVVDADDKLLGTLNTRFLVTLHPSMLLKNTKLHRHFVRQDESFEQIMRLFAEYNMRTLPVVDADSQVLGIIKIDTILGHIQQEEEREDAM